MSLYIKWEKHRYDANAHLRNAETSNLARLHMVVVQMCCDISYQIVLAHIQRIQRSIGCELAQAHSRRLLLARKIYMDGVSTANKPIYVREASI